jgi:hypothetical protein
LAYEGVKVAYIKRQRRIATKVSLVKVNVTGTKNEILLNNYSLLWRIDTKLDVWIAYIKRQPGVCDQS